MDVFKKAQKSKPKKSNAALIEDPSIEDACAQLVRTSRDFKNAKAAHENAQAALIDYISPIHLASLKSKSLTKTFKLNEKVMCIFTDKFKNLSPDDRKDVEELLEEAKIPIERLFAEKLSLKLNKSIEEDSDKLTALHELLGEEKFNEYFEFDVKFAPVDEFYKSLVREGGVEVLQDVIPQFRNKPTVKVS